MTAAVFAEPTWADDWARVRQHVAAALEYAGGTHDEADVVDAILADRMQLWPGQACAVVTEIVQYPRLKECRFFAAGGDLQELLAMEPRIVAWARDQGCTRIGGGGRLGWGRVMDKHGYRRAYAVMWKDI